MFGKVFTLVNRMFIKIQEKYLLNIQYGSANPSLVLHLVLFQTTFFIKELYWFGIAHKLHVCFGKTNPKKIHPTSFTLQFSTFSIIFLHKKLI